MCTFAAEAVNVELDQPDAHAVDLKERNKATDGSKRKTLAFKNSEKNHSTAPDANER